MPGAMKLCEHIMENLSTALTDNYNQLKYPDPIETNLHSIVTRSSMIHKDVDELRQILESLQIQDVHIVNSLLWSSL